MANTIKKSHSQTRHRSEQPFADLMGPISPSNFRTGDLYIVIFVCDFSCYVFTYTLKNKRAVHLAFSLYLQEIESIISQLNNVFRIKSDRGLEQST